MAGLNRNDWRGIEKCPMSKAQQQTEVLATGKISGKKGNCLRSVEEWEPRMRVVWHHSAASYLLLLIHCTGIEWRKIIPGWWNFLFILFCFEFFSTCAITVSWQLTIKLLLPVALCKLLFLLDISSQNFVVINTLLVAEVRIPIVFPEIICY